MTRGPGSEESAAAGGERGDPAKADAAEQRARRQERFLESIVENIPDMIFVKDAAELRFVLFNRAGEELLGHPRADLQGKNDHDLFPAEEADFFTAKDRQVLAEGRVFDIPEERIHTGERGVRLLHTKKIPILDERGRPEYLLGISEDITDRRQAEEQLRAIVVGTASAVGKDFFQELVRNLAGALDVPVVFACTRVGPARSVARTLAVWQGGRLGENFEYALAGTPCEDVASDRVSVYVGGLRERFPDDAWLADLGAETYIGIPFIASSGEMVGHLGIVDTRRRDDHASMRPVLEIFANRAVAELERARAEQALVEQAAELQRSNAELDQFAGVASHDLQEPLRKIQAFGQLLPDALGGEIPPAARDYLDRMLAAADRMQSLIHDLLAFSRVSTQPRALAEVDLGQVAREVVLDLEVAAGARVTIGDLPSVRADRLQMRQLLQNLIGNALKFHARGEPARVDVSARKVGGAWELAVADEGIGFDEKYLDRIFRPFQRLHTAKEYRGTGIGLAICKKIAEHHGGSLRATSTPGEGSTFVVTLPGY
jgi:PAS domain S-box-containing protein